MLRNKMLAIVTVIAVAIPLSGCAVVSVADAAVSVTSTAVKIGANAVGAVVDVARAGVKAITGSDDPNKK